MRVRGGVRVCSMPAVLASERRCTRLASRRVRVRFGSGLGLWLGVGLRFRLGFERRCTRGCNLLISALATTCLVRVEI